MKDIEANKKIKCIKCIYGIFENGKYKKEEHKNG